MKTVYAFDSATKLYQATIQLNDSDRDPLDGGWLIPAHCLEIEPPVTPAGKRVRAINGAWVLEDIPAPPPAPAAPVVEAPPPIKINPASFLKGQTPPARTTESEQERLVAHVQRYLDTMAQSFGYDSIATAVTYAEEPAVEKFQTEGRSFRAWRSQVWARCYELLDDVLNGRRSIPSEQELIALVPQYTPPQEEQQG